MKYRREDNKSDYVFGAGDNSAFFNSPDAVAQAVKSRLDLATGDWFLDTEEGTPYKELILGKQRSDVYNQAIKERILGTQGVLNITEYKSEFNPDTRKVIVSITINTLYGDISINEDI